MSYVGLLEKKVVNTRAAEMLNSIRHYINGHENLLDTDTINNIKKLINYLKNKDKTTKRHILYNLKSTVYNDDVIVYKIFDVMKDDITLQRNSDEIIKILEKVINNKKIKDKEEAFSIDFLENLIDKFINMNDEMSLDKKMKWI